MKRSRGYHSKAIKALKAERKLTPADFVREFLIGEKVRIVPVPYYKAGQIPHRRYKNMVGEVIDKRGEAYIIKINLGNSYRELVVLPIHLKRL